MFVATAKTQRFLKLTQFVLTFVSVCAVADSTRIEGPPTDRPGYYSGAGQQRAAARDRRLGDLARTERKRREAEQQANRRRTALTVAFSAHATQQRGFEALEGSKAGGLTDSSICACCRFSETVSAAARFTHHTDQSVAVDHAWHASCNRRLEPRNGSTA